MDAPDRTSTNRETAAARRVPDATLVDAFLTRRSRRFALGSRLHGSALAYASEATPSR